MKVKQRGFFKGDLVLKIITGPIKKGKLSLNWEGPFRVVKKLSDIEIPRTWHVSSLRIYFR